MSHQVKIVPQAVLDIEEIHDYIFVKEGPGPALKILEVIQKTISLLSRTPNRGHFPSELEGLGMTDIREIHFKPYRIVYQIGEKTVLVLVVADGRRDFQSLLSRRLVR